jgi:hypothetical protein
MAQVIIPDEQYYALTALAQEQGLTLEQLLDRVIERLERDDQRAFWGDDIDEDLRRQMATTEGSACHLSEDEFFAELDAVTPAAGNRSDADV